MQKAMLYDVGGKTLTRDQIAEAARRAGLTAEDLAPPSPVVVKETAFERHIERSDGRIVRLLKLTDAKYGVLVEPAGSEARGQIANMVTGVPIPADEPIMIFRAQDRHALAALETYCRVVTADGTAVSPQTAHSAQERFMLFQDFQASLPQRVKTPT